MKYSEEELRDMAKIAMAARDAGDPRFNALVMFLSAICGMQPQQVVANIEALAAKNG